MLESLIRCALVTMAPFPVGNVSTLRFSSYMRTLVKAGIFSYVLVYCPTTMAKHIQSRCGVSDGINFQYATRITWKRGFRIEKIIYLMIGLLKSVYFLKKNRINVMILYGDNHFAVTFFFFFACKLLKIRLIGDRSELPTVAERDSKIKSFVYEKKQSFFDGMIVMTRRLKEYYSRFFDDAKRLFFLPMTIDSERFRDVVKDTISSPYIAVVFGTHNRDGLEESIKSFAFYKNQLKGFFNLVLVGDYEKMPNKKTLDELISQNHLNDVVEIKGKIPNEMVPQILKNASCLLTTPNFYVSGGFPTKLGEYMLSGVPIVATEAGELLDYIVPNEELLMSPAGNIEMIAKNILFVEKNPAKCKRIAENAIKKASTVFNADTYKASLIEFLKGA